MRTGPMKGLLSRPIAFHPALARLCGSVTAGLMLSQAIYWSERTEGGCGWFYKTQAQWQEEICLSRTEQDTARRILRERGFVKEELRGMPAKVFFCVDLDAVCEALNESSSGQPSSLQETSKQERVNPANKLAGNQQASVQETCKQDRGNPASMPDGNQQPFLIGSETTPETTHHHASGALENWFSIKNEMRSVVGPDEWQLWVRPAYLLSVMSGGVLLIALPPSGRIVERARSRLPDLCRLAEQRGYRGLVYTRYPDEYERERIKREYPDIAAQWVSFKGETA